MTLVAALGRIDDIQQRIRSLSADAAGSPVTDAAGSVIGASASAGSTASAFANAVRDVGGLGPATDGAVTGDDVVAQAKSYLGVPYVFGGEDRSGMDCSGLVQRVFADLGIDVPRVVKDQADVGVEVPSLADAQPGDLLVTKDEGHIVIYAGDGMVIHAPKPGEVVELRRNWLKDSDLATIRRIVPAAVDAAPASVASATAPASGAPLPAGTPDAAAQAARALTAALASTGPASTALASPGPASTALASPGPASPSLDSPGPRVAQSTPPASGSADSAAALAAAQALSRALSTASAGARPIGEAGATPLTAAGSTAASENAVAALAAALGANGASSARPLPDASAATPLPHAMRTPLAQQITSPVLSLAGRADGEHTMTLRVSPDELGPVTVKAHIVGGTISIELASSSAAGRDALRALLADLRRDLAGLAPHATVALASADAPRGESSATGSGTGWGSGASTSDSSGQSAGGDTSDRSSAERGAGRDTSVATASGPTTPSPAAPAPSGIGIDLFA